ncbi:MAG: hypothetical protein UX10_C0005G0030 [Candidatus Magasanikbacteria bacterium GW2011_GWA2_45_39]|uniref:ATP-grasp domain-containing protein n=1 Tax=Candidatus Magasanikbacteria bacterium GW2011_GWA2_45_39 TaxID=1619041 RepID=A0A0G1MHY8_9BACT|nr:MAG: hypothetical protein UX10_C0005G0030 [Candidatus Magasanikbacteria bacterium GW2011_GWA2_45_39]
MSKTSHGGRGRVSLHAALDDYPQSSHIPYVHTYADRATLAGSSVCILLADDRRPDLSLYLMWLAGEGIGPEQIYWVEPNGVPDRLYPAIAQDLVLRAKLIAYAHRGGKIDLFSPSAVAETFLVSLGLGWNHTTFPTPDAASVADDKLKLRSLAVGIKGLRDVFPQHHLCKSETALKHAFGNFLHAHDGVVIKDPCSVSTDGMIFTRDAGGLEEFIARFWNPRHGAIVEALHPHLPVSAVWDLSEKGPRFMYVSLQFMDGVPYGQYITMEDLLKPNPCKHRGNAVASRTTLGPIEKHHMEAVQEQTRKLASVLWYGTPGIAPYRGRICLDCLLLPDGQVLITEANARISNSMYAFGVLEQVKRGFAGGKVVVLMSNEHTRLKSFQELRWNMGCQLYTAGRGGLIPYHVRAMPGGKCGLIAVAPTYREALEMLTEGECHL